MKKFLIYFIFLVCCFFIYDMKDVYAESNYWNNFTLDFSECTLPSCTFANDAYTSTLVLSESGTYSYNVIFSQRITGIDEFVFTTNIYNTLYTTSTDGSLGIYNDMPYVDGFKSQDTSFYNLNPILIGLNSKHAQCTGYYAGNDSITYRCLTDFTETYYGIAFKFVFNKVSENASLRLSFPRFASIYYGNHSSLDDVIQNQDKNQQETNNKLDETNKELGDLNDNLTDDTIDNSTASGFFDGYQDNDYGLSSVITAPLQFIQNLNSNVCTELSVPIPYVNKTLKLPCMSTIYSNYFGSFFSLYQAITTGFIAYWVAVRIFALVKGFKDPEDDKIEVMDL